jgi:hypothetical protein
MIAEQPKKKQPRQVVKIANNALVFLHDQVNENLNKINCFGETFT